MARFSEKWKASGTQLAPENRDWQNVPILNWNSNNRQVKVNTNWDNNRNSNYAVPEVRDCSSE